MTKSTVSLVLGSGAARGLAHIGILRWLGENDFEVRSIAGSSMGALVGGIYAAGKLDIYEDWVLALEPMDVLRLLDVSWNWTALLKGDRIIDALRELVGDQNIEDLPIAFTAVATDIESEKEVWLSKGSLFDAIRASIAIPTIFTPHEINGRRLLDGGLTNPVPIAPTLNDATDFTIAVNLNAQSERLGAPAEKRPRKPKGESVSYHEKIRSFIDGLQTTFGAKSTKDWDLVDIITRSFDTMQSQVARLKLAAYSPDVIISIPRNAARAFEFDRAAEMIELGYQRAQSELSHLRKA